MAVFLSVFQNLEVLHLSGVPAIIQAGTIPIEFEEQIIKTKIRELFVKDVQINIGRFRESQLLQHLDAVHTDDCTYSKGNRHALDILALVEKNKTLQTEIDTMRKRFESVEKLVRFDFQNLFESFPFDPQHFI